MKAVPSTAGAEHLSSQSGCGYRVRLCLSLHSLVDDGRMLGRGLGCSRHSRGKSKLDAVRALEGELVGGGVFATRLIVTVCFPCALCPRIQSKRGFLKEKEEELCFLLIYFHSDETQERRTKKRSEQAIPSSKANNSQGNSRIAEKKCFVLSIREGLDAEMV